MLLLYPFLTVSMIKRKDMYRYVYKHSVLSINTEAYMHAYMHAYIHAYIHTYIPTYLHTYIHTYIHTYSDYMYIHRSLSLETEIYIYISNIYMYIYLFIFIYIYIYLYIYAYLSIQRIEPRGDSARLRQRLPGRGTRWRRRHGALNQE